jgi:hypothetical protein
MTVLPFPSPEDRDYGPNVRNEDPQTSHEAADEAPCREAIRIRLLRCYARAMRDFTFLADAGLTDEEAMETAEFDLADDGHRRRCSDLRQAGLIAPIIVNGEPFVRRSARTNKNRMVCAITRTGIDLLIGDRDA